VTRGFWLAGAFVLACALPCPALAQKAITIDVEHERVHPAPLVVHVDGDDDDEDGTLDASQQRPPSDDLYSVRVQGAATFTLAVEGPLALLADGVRSAGPLSVRGEKPRVTLQATAISERGKPAVVVVTSGARVLRVPVDTAALRYLDARDRVLDPRVDALGISRRITHDRSLPRGADASVTSDDAENVRIELEAPAVGEDVVFAQLVARGPEGVRVLRHVPLLRVDKSARFRSPFLRLVSDDTDASAPDVSSQLLRANLRDRVDARVLLGRSVVESTLSVGLAGKRGGPRAVLKGSLRLTVLRGSAGGPPVLGDDDVQAVELARSQVEIANEIWAQCFVTFGRPSEAAVRLVDPPPSALLSIGDIDGLPARGDGVIVVRAGTQRIGPVPTRKGATPVETARDVARAMMAKGLKTEVTVNPRTEVGAGPSADIVVRSAQGALVSLTAEAGVPVSSDAQQRVAIGIVDLSDGIQEFDNALAASGTLEERALVKLLADGDPSTIDVLLINRFVNRDRQGEAFIEADGSSMANVLIFDRNAVRFDRQAWVQAHELGHVLLDEAFHPDSIEIDRPWLLMDSDARQGRVTGPKRLRDEECARVRRRSGPEAHPVLLAPAP
jgi:hypothetical protein